MKNTTAVFIKKILRKFNSINVILIAIISFFAVKGFDIWSAPFEHPRIQPYKARQAPRKKKIRDIIKKESVDFSFYEDITKNNLFRPDRKNYVPPPPPPTLPPPPELPPPPPPKKKVPPPKLKLNGILSIGDRKNIALISGQYFTPKSRVNLKYQKYREGDMLGDYKIKEIKEKSVILKDDYAGDLLTLNINFSSFKSSGIRRGGGRGKSVKNVRNLPLSIRRKSANKSRDNNGASKMSTPAPAANKPSALNLDMTMFEPQTSGGSKEEIPAVYRGGRVYYPKNGSPPPPPPQRISGVITSPQTISGNNTVP